MFCLTELNFNVSIAYGQKRNSFCVRHVTFQNAEAAKRKKNRSIKNKLMKNQ